EISASHFDEEGVVSRPYFPDFATIDDRRKGEGLTFCIAQVGQTIMSRENPAELQTLGMHEQDLPQRHDRIHAQWREGDFVRPHHIVGDRKLDGCKPIESDRY